MLKTKRIFLFLNLFFILTVVAYYIKSYTDSKVLQASTVSLTKINKYDLQYKEKDGTNRSIVPADCTSNFTTSTMDVTCTRNMATPSTFWPSPPYGLIAGSFSIGLDLGPYNNKNMYAYAFNITGTTNFNIFEKDFKIYRPILEEAAGFPVLSYYGGLYEINKSTNTAYLLTRYFNTAAYYSKGCENSRTPQNLYRIDYYDATRSQNTSVFTYGMSGLEGTSSYTYFNCSAQEYDAFQAALKNKTQLPDKQCYSCGGTNPTYFNCARGAAEALAAPELMEPKLRVSSLVSAWRQEYSCKSFDNKDFHFNMPKTHQIVVSKCNTGETCSNSGNLTVVRKTSQQPGPISAGYAFDDFRASCIRKSNDGSCGDIILSKALNDLGTNSELVFSYTSKTKISRLSTGRGYSLINSGIVKDTNGYYNDFAACEWDNLAGGTPTNCLARTCNSMIEDKSKTIAGYTSIFSPFVNYTFGYETPKIATYRAIDFTKTINSKNFLYKIPKYFCETQESLDPIIPAPSVATPTDFVNVSNRTFSTDNHAFSLFVDTNYLTVRRFGNDDSITVASYAFKEYYPEFRKLSNISVAVARDGTDQIDLLFSSSPSAGFTPSTALATDSIASDLRVFRINNALTTDQTKTITIEDISSKINFGTSTSRIYPRTFRRYFDSNLNKDYYVWVTNNDVYTSDVPSSSLDSTCNININNISITNTSPLTILNGLKNYSDTGTNNIDFRLGAPFECTGNTGLLPSSIKLKAMDPISGNQVGGIFSTTLDTDKQKFSFNLDSNFVSSKKYNFELTFVVGGTNYVYNSTLKPTVMPKGYFFSFESKLNLELYDVLPDGTSQPSYDTVLKFSKNAGSTVQIDPGSSEVLIGSDDIGGFADVYFDHNLGSVSGGQIDSVTNTICFVDKAVKNISYGEDVANPTNYINTNVSSDKKCIDTVYKSNSTTSYDLKPITLKIYFDVTEQPSPGSLSNFEINGNLFTKSDIGKVIRTFPSTLQVLQGNYIASSNVTSSTEKTFDGSSLSFTKYLPLPTSLTGYNLLSGNILESTNLRQFNLLLDPNPNLSSNVVYSTLKGNSANDYEIIVVSGGKGVKIDLSNANLEDTTNILDKYVLINLDKTKSRITFFLDCDKAEYSTICTPGTTYYFKGLLVGKFDIDGKLNNGIDTKKFINVAENSDIFMKILQDIREDKKPLINTTKINLKYIN